MRNRDKQRQIARRAMTFSAHVAKIPCSTNPDRIKAIQVGMITPNFTREGVGHIQKRGTQERINVGTANEPIPYDVYRLTSRTTIHSVPPSGFYRGRYR